MVKHIVLFKLKDEAPADEKLAAMNSFKAAIEALPAKISVIRKIEVGLNINPAEAWSIALYSEFDTLDDVKYYATHPDHVAAGKLIAAVKESRACVDYEIIEIKIKSENMKNYCSLSFCCSSLWRCRHRYKTPSSSIPN